MTAPPARSPRFDWGSNAQIGFALGAIVLATGTLIALAFGVLLPLLLKDQRELFTGSPRELLSNAILLAYSVLFVGLVIVRFGRVSLRELGWVPDRLGRDLGWGLLAHALTQAIFLGVMALQGQGALSLFTTLVHFSLARRGEALLIAAQASFLEESLYRGFLQRGLRARTTPWRAVSLTAALFALAHLRFDPLHLLTNFAYGLVWGWLRERTGSLFAPAFAHSLNWAVNAGL